MSPHFKRMSHPPIHPRHNDKIRRKKGVAYIKACEKEKINKGNVLDVSYFEAWLCA